MRGELFAGLDMPPLVARRGELNDAPLVTVVNLSGGSQSLCLAYMILLGEVDRPEGDLVFLTADPGMERDATYPRIREIQEAASEAGIVAETAPGPNLLEDLLDDGPRTRIDNPPYWLHSPTSKNGRGQLTQKCTRYYKIEPMDRWLRAYLEDHHGISRRSSRLPHGCVEKWIGFAADEVGRVKPPNVKYQQYRYPLIDLGMSRRNVSQWYVDHGIEEPVRSACKACFSNGLETYRGMSEEELDVVQSVDERLARGLPGSDAERLYVSPTLVPFREIRERGFGKQGDLDPQWSCDSGHCFL